VVKRGNSILADLPDGHLPIAARGGACPTPGDQRNSTNSVDANEADDDALFRPFQSSSGGHPNRRRSAMAEFAATDTADPIQIPPLAA
jgi:hypothetical protein